MRRFVLLLALLLPLPATAWTGVADAQLQSGFTALGEAVRARDEAQIAQHITENSRPLVSRFASYDLLPCLPGDASIVSVKKEGAQATVLSRFTVPHVGAKQARLIFVKKQAGWQLDLPATLQRGMGAAWQSKVNTAEQLYLLMRQQMGGALDCAALQSLVSS